MDQGTLIEIGKEQNPLEKELKNYLNRASSDLGIDPPTLKIIPDQLGYLAYNDKLNHLYAPLGVKRIHKDLFRTRIRKQITFRSHKQKLLFLFFHEIGHAWHFQKHRTHWDKFEINYKHMGWCDLEEYMTQQSERIADQIAVILFKHYRLE